MVERARNTIRSPNGEMITTTWAAFVAGTDTGESLDLGEGNVSDMVASFDGTFGTGNFGMQHSVDGVVWIDAVDPGGTALAITADGGSEIRGGGQFWRPALNSGTPTSVVPTFQVRKITR